mmetsp:Transcript_3060/g.6879  ORF Transcript_3060/g.6879 Transcript_3060/m.6879 type:complete len:247 (+) Transcript_3060:98-838(+)|eukprot:CAMPEP_0178448788 /NCGR_PEP_ID=MMETSP0689_2-20121128/42185_1 /TAXON_ID=160604 /ORGANISM="Amphidinium massartii, Strain CS-259" /LENGTH=246 /DNA_ID=CAMNT_0020074025 /DNA_START=91 /DNA_END=831 /DNA_ORIENTATION=+
MVAARVTRNSRRATSVLPLIALLCSMPLMVGQSGSFVAPRSSPRQPTRVAMLAEGSAPPTPPAPAPAPAGESVALVKVDDESMTTTAGLLGGLAGLLVGGVWVGGALFAVTSYLAKKEGSDISTGLKGISKGVLEGLNFSNYVNDKYSVTSQVGSALSGAIDKNVKPEDKKNLDSTISTVSSSIDSFDKEVDIKKTFGTLAVGAADLAFQAVEKAIEFNEKNKVTDKIADKIKELASKADKPSSQP